MIRLSYSSVVPSIAIMLLVATPTYATSGACSFHGGVDCSAGADLDNSVICNDGWRDSGVSFGSMSECNQVKHTCTAPTAIGCSKELDYLRLSTGITAGIIPVTAIPAAEQLRNCRTQINNFRSIVKIYNVCLEAENQVSHMSPAIPSNDPNLMCWQSFGIHSEPSTTTGSCTCDSNYTFNNAIDTCIYDLKDDPQDIQAAITAGFGSLAGQVSIDADYKCPAFSAMNIPENACKCNPGFFGVLGTCVVAPVYCHAKYGPNGDWNSYSNSCECHSGYQIDTNTHQCASIADACISKFGMQTIVVSGTCTCRQGAKIDPLTGKCESITMIAQRDALSTISTTLPTLPAENSISSSQASNNQPPILSNPVNPSKTNSLFYIGSPKTKQDLLNCFIVGNRSNHLYYLRGNPTIKQMSPKNKECFVSEEKARIGRFRKVK